MAFSLFDHAHWKALFARYDLAALFEPEAEIEAMLRFETALAEAEADVGVIPKASASAISRAVIGFHPDTDMLAIGVARDGLIVPALISALRQTLDEVHRPHLHVGATSQDLIDTGLILRLKSAVTLLRGDIEGLVARLEQLSGKHGEVRVMGRTRMQRALPITLAHRIGTWKEPLNRLLEALDDLENNLFVIQFGGPVGTLEALGGEGARVRALLANRLNLNDPGRCWHTERDRIVDLAGWLSKVAGSLGKIGQDVMLMAQNEVGEVSIQGGGRSSAMPHKKNPVHAELLVTLARYGAGQVGAAHQALVHEGERSGNAWTLEWMVLPQLVATTGAALSIAGTMLDALDIRGG